jgi:hypothetical protein
MNPFMCKVWFAAAKRGFVHRMRVREVSIFVILSYGGPADDGAGRRAPGPERTSGIDKEWLTSEVAVERGQKRPFRAYP